MLSGARKKPNQEAAHGEEEDQQCPQHHDQVRAATAADLAHSNAVRDDKQNEEQEGPEGIVGHGLGSRLCWLCVCVCA